MSNKPGSNWDESQQNEPASTKGGAPGAPAAAVRDGFEDSQSDGHQHSAQDEDVVDATVRKKGSPLVPKILMGVMGLAIVGVLGFFGMGMMKSLGGNKAPRVATAPRQITEMPRPGTGTVLMGEPQAAPLVQAPVAIAVPAMATMPVTTIAASATSKSAPVAPEMPDSRMAQADERARHLEDEVRTLREQLARQTTANAAAAGSFKVARASVEMGAPTASRSPRAHRVVRAKPEKVEKVEAPMITEVAEKETPIEIARLQLRGVFPRSGDDMQAWLMDGDKTRTVTRGDMINGAKVLRVEADRVVTDRGMIH